MTVRPAEVRCIRCGYVLRGIPEIGDCPECGTPVQSTTLLPILKKVAEQTRLPTDPRHRRFVIAIIVVIVVALVLAAIEIWFV